MPSSPPSGAILTGLEGGDVFAGLGVDSAFGVLSGTERHDAFAGMASITHGSLSATGGNDTAAIAGTWIVATLTGSGRSDTLIGGGGFGSSGSAAITAGGDTLAALGRLTASASMAATAGSDTASAAGMLTGHGALSMSGGADVLAALGFYGPPGVLTAAGRNDTAALLGGMATTAALAATERHDVSAGGVGSGLEYHIYSNTGIGDPIDYSTVIATTGLLTWTSGPLTYPGTWRFGVRAFDTGGEEENLDCAVTLILDSSGNDISLRPASPIGLRAFATAGGGIRVEWAYNTINPAVVPTGFHVYIGTTGIPNYGSVAATVLFATAIAGTFVANLAGLTNGTTYTIGVRAYNAVTEEPNTATVNCTADSVGPSAVVSLTGIAIV
jgi:hypothetical protein